ncbi:MAG: GTPase Era, partial [Alphaproteobacteria bacterium]
VQTTRTRIRGVAITGPVQIVFVDTPGIFAPRRRLDRAMVAAAWEGAAEADAIVVVVDAPRLAAKDGGGKSGEDTKRIIEGLREANLKAILVLNKIDAMKREDLLALTERLFDPAVFTDNFMISAEQGDGVEDLLNHLAARMPEGPWLYPEDQAADITERLLAAEVTREKLFLRLHQELPYASTVETESWQERKDGSIRIEQLIFVERDSQKAIVLGKGGRTIREIGEAARKDMGQMFGRKVHLFLHVKVREKWGDDPARYRGMGLEFPKG